MIDIFTEYDFLAGAALGFAAWLAKNCNPYHVMQEKARIANPRRRKNILQQFDLYFNKSFLFLIE